MTSQGRWTLVAFFGGSIVFFGINQLAEDESTLTRLGLQVLALAAIIAVIVWLVRRQG